MEFQFDHQLYRIAFRHEPSRNWVDHHGHGVRLARAVLRGGVEAVGPTVLYCVTCSMQLSHIPKREQGQRRVWCTIFREIDPNDESIAPDADRWQETEWRGVAKLNLKKGDTYSREKGRAMALKNALGGLAESKAHARYNKKDPAFTNPEPGSIEATLLAEQKARRSFRAAAWQAYRDRQRMKARTA